MIAPDPIHAEQFLRFLFTRGELVELRALDCSGPHNVYAGIYDDLGEASRDAAAISARYSGKLFYGLNPVNPASKYAQRTRNGYRPGREALHAAAVLERRHLLIDFDPMRPAGVCATDAEKAQAVQAADTVISALLHLGWPELVRIDSGNGVHLVFSVSSEIENDAVKGFLLYVRSLLFELPGVEVDLKVRDLPRIARLPGMPNRKGEHSSERPHRLAQVVSFPDAFQPLPVESLLMLARQHDYVPAEERPQRTAGGGESTTEADISQLIEQDYPECFSLASVEEKHGATYFLLDKCPYVNRAHTGTGGSKTCSALRLLDGQVSFHCFGCEKVSMYRLIRSLIERTGKRPTNAALEAPPPEPDIDQYQSKWEIASAAVVEPQPAPKTSPRPTPATSPAAPMPIKPRLYLDLETFSECNLKECGSYNYATHPSTEVLLLSYAYGEGPVTLLDLTASPELPAQLRVDLESPALEKVAWNATFEMLMLTSVKDIRVNVGQWFDPVTLFRYLNLPRSASLADACKALGITADQAKLKDGKALVKRFCELQKTTKRNIAAGEPAQYRATAANAPEEWLRFGEYNVQDVVALREATRLLEERAPLPKIEHKNWCLDQISNLQGIPMDLAYIRFALRIEQEDGKDRSCLTYATTKGRSRLWGSMMTAHTNSAICRDLLCFAIDECHRAGLHVILSIHDEIVLVESDDDAEAAKNKLGEIMSRAPVWADGLLLKCEPKIMQLFAKE